MNSVWLLIVCSILSARHENIPLNHLTLSSKIKSEIKDRSKAYKKLGTACRYLPLSECLHSHEAERFHWTLHKITSEL